jgi:hypothetical protein
LDTFALGEGEDEDEDEDEGTAQEVSGEEGVIGAYT